MCKGRIYCKNDQFIKEMTYYHVSTRLLENLSSYNAVNLIENIVEEEMLIVFNSSII